MILNYRPILLTCILRKVMEHVVASNLARNLDKIDFLFGLQHSFREKRSCETQLIELVEDLGKQPLRAIRSIKILAWLSTK